MDTALQIVVSIGMYVLIFVVIGFVFAFADRRVKRYLRRPATCRKCSSEIAPGTSRVRGLCAACVAKRRPAQR
jgi:threonine/homoserine/homoserine lactone efflux protein